MEEKIDLGPKRRGVINDYSTLKFISFYSPGNRNVLSSDSLNGYFGNVFRLAVGANEGKEVCKVEEATHS